MTIKRFYVEYGKPIVITLLGVMLVTAFSSYVATRVVLAEIRKDIENTKDRTEFIEAINEYQGEAITRLIYNQHHIADNTNVTLNYTFENLGTIRGE